MKDKSERVRNLVNAGPLPGMSEAFDAHMGADCWTDPAYAPDASMWAAAWKAATAAERDRWMQASEAVSVGAEAAGRPGVQTVTQIRLLALGPNVRAKPAL